MGYSQSYELILRRNEYQLGSNVQMVVDMPGDESVVAANIIEVFADDQTIGLIADRTAKFCFPLLH
jgi:hypothetical protein